LPRLSVNVDHVATVREARKTFEPDPVAAAILAEMAGAHGITVHLRRDRRHVQERDVRILREIVQTRLTLEMTYVDELVAFALAVRPDCVTLVPERPEEVSTEGGLDVATLKDSLTHVVQTLKEGGIEVCFFVDPTFDQIKAAAKAGADAVEIHTGRYADAPAGDVRRKELEAIEEAARMGSRFGLTVNAGHGLTYSNVRPIALLPPMHELSIGHTIVSRALMVGFADAVREMVRLVGT
jgi:pyridoxine 5-phosphate synthase